MIRHLPRLAATALTLMAAGLVQAATALLPGPVVDAAWLSTHLDQVQIVDVRSHAKTMTASPEFETDAKGRKNLTEVGGHISGSRLLEFKSLRTDRMIGGLKVSYMLPEQAAFEKTVQAAGIDAGRPIVLVAVGSDTTDLDDALRAYWQFKVYGEDSIAVLDGGMAGWLSEGRTFSTDAVAPRTGTWKAVADRSARYGADSDAVAAAIARRSTSLVDARDLRQYHGLTKRDYVYAAGHLEGARLFPSELWVRQSGAAVRFLAPATYRGLLEAQGIDPNRPAIAYCNSGHLASAPWFILSEVLGNAEARLYDGSMHEWTLEKRPVVGAVTLN